MKKGFKYFAIAWAILFALFSLVFFLSPVFSDVNRFEEVSFWIEYVLFALILVGHLLFAKVSIHDETPTQTFYALNFADKVVRGAFISFVIAIICALLPFIPNFLGVIICAIVFVITMLSVAKPKLAANEVERIDKEVKEKTFFIKSLTIDAETLTDRAKDEDVKAACRKVAEALRYSDPMSSEALTAAESAITIKFASLQNAVTGGDKEKALADADELIILINDRNRKCKLLK